jgi:uncharacterized protein YecE (DUF72 family)
MSEGSPPPIRVGIGGWTFPPWRGPFYPEGLPHAQELSHASRRVTTIEVNGTFYGSQKPATFRRWADETPDGFVFSLKAPRYAVNRRELAGAGPSMERFVASGIEELGDKLGPILWQLPPTKAFDAVDLAAFLALMPREVSGRPLRHALEVRHASFRDDRLARLLREHGVALVLADDDTYPMLTERTAGFTYARLRRCSETEPTGYGAAALDEWAGRFKRLATGTGPCFAYFINGAKIHAPAAAMALIERLSA